MPVLHCCAGFSLVAASRDYSPVVVRQLLIAGEGNGTPLQCSCLENSRDGGAWWAAIYGSHRVGHDWSDVAAAATAASHCSGFSCCGVQALAHAGFCSCGSQALEHRLNNCGTRASFLRGMWDLSRLGAEPVPPALAGRYFTPEPPEKPLSFLNVEFQASIFTLFFHPHPEAL